MTCQEFLARFSEFYDRGAVGPDRRAFEAHLDQCGSCSRYAEVVRKGSELLQSLPELDVPSNFRPRLQHRIYHVEDGHALDRSSATSATTAMTALAMSVLLALAAWAPSLLSTGPEEVELQPIVVNRPEARSTFFSNLSQRATSSLFTGQSEAALVPAGAYPAIWDRSNTFLYQYSPLSERNRPRLVRTGLD